MAPCLPPQSCSVPESAIALMGEAANGTHLPSHLLLSSSHTSPQTSLLTSPLTSPSPPPLLPPHLPGEATDSPLLLPHPPGKAAKSFTSLCDFLTCSPSPYCLSGSPMLSNNFLGISLLNFLFIFGGIMSLPPASSPLLGGKPVVDSP